MQILVQPVVLSFSWLHPRRRRPPWPHAVSQTDICWNFWNCGRCSICEIFRLQVIVGSIRPSAPSPPLETGARPESS